MQPLRGNEIAIGTLMRRNRVVPTCQPRSALKGPVLVPRARGFLMTCAKRLDRQDSNANIPDRAQLSVRRKSALSLVVAPIASELMPGQGQFDQSLPIGPFGRRGALHRRLGFMLGVVLGTHAAKFNQPIWTSAWQFRPYDCGGRKSHRRARFRTMVPRQICRCDRELRGLASRRRRHVKSAKTARTRSRRSSHFPHSANSRPRRRVRVRSRLRRILSARQQCVASGRRAHKPVRPAFIPAICEVHHSRVPARSLNSALRAARTRHRKDGCSPHDTQGRSRSTGSRIIAQDRPVRSLLLAAIVLVMTIWIGGLVWAAMAFLTWLVS